MNKIRKFTFWEVGTYKQETSKNEIECERHLKESCERCRKSSSCNENECPIYKAYATKLMILEAERLREKNILKTEFVTTRKYDIKSMTQRKRIALSNITKMYKKELSYEKEMLLDEINVHIEMEDFEYALKLMYKHGLRKTAAKLAEILRKKTWFNNTLSKGGD